MTDGINAMGWKFEDILRATGLIRGVGDMFIEETLASLIASELPSSIFDLTGDRLEAWIASMNGLDEPTREKFAQTMHLIVNVGRRMLDGLAEAMVSGGLVLPDPDTVTIPDTVPEQWTDGKDTP
jgi:hypothetical protein